MGARGPQPQPKQITADHVQILAGIARGLTNSQIAVLMNRNEHWVHGQLKIVFDVLGVRTRAQAVAVAVQKRLLPRRNMR